MEKWQKDFFEMLETVADEVDRFFQGVSEVVDSVFEISEEITEQVHNTFTIEIDQYLNDLADPLLEVYWELEEFVGEAEHSFPYEIEPSPEQNPACIGCHHYHGQVYNANLLVCAMHPYGWDDNNCPDWESY
jgi:hypothetical protein